MMNLCTAPMTPPCDRPIQHSHVQMCGAHYQQQRDGRPFSVPRVSSLERNEQGQKRCRQCREWLPEESFGKAKGALDGLACYCLPCIRAKQRATLATRRIRNREKYYNLSAERFDAILAAQGGRCAICLSDSAGSYHDWCVDHDHRCCPQRGRSCGECVRGILCTACNKAIGLLRDDQVVASRAAAYLAQYSLKLAV